MTFQEIKKHLSSTKILFISTIKFEQSWSIKITMNRAIKSSFVYNPHTNIYRKWEKVSIAGEISFILFQLGSHKLPSFLSLLQFQRACIHPGNMNNPLCKGRFKFQKSRKISMYEPCQWSLVFPHMSLRS